MKDRPFMYFAFSNKKHQEIIFNCFTEFQNNKDFYNFFAFKYFNKFDKNIEISRSSRSSSSSNQNSNNILDSPKKSIGNNNLNNNGWNIYEYYFEYRRMGVELESKVKNF
jgi:hypothetical protein